MNTEITSTMHCDAPLSEKTFSKGQWLRIFAGVIFAVLVGGTLAYCGVIDVLQIGGPLLTSSIVLLGFALTVLSLMIKAAVELKKGWFYDVLFKNGVYHSLIRNGKWLLTALLLNIIIGFLLHVIGPKYVLHPYVSLILQCAVLAELAFVYALLWYTVKRFLYVITQSAEYQQREDREKEA